ncbi:phosphocholine-specific phospholipase C [Variovorax ginsengisoli]|uniref:phospholipase C n=1 Tax=Variovorax ginsengisoli TaxID=363844 RepID=A0ABT9S9S9_9BURK|nr:phospholipase C, phosphocholine-specific [Variovorax ginsengisoli]MDP9900588.1 phospholipase C [Variovorax ginsengisoli]
MTSRRTFLRGTASAGIAAATLAAFPPAIRRALAIPANNATGTIKDVEHIVILMQENRSFDHYFGTLMGVRGFGDRFTIPLPAGLSVWQQSDAKGALVLPYHLDGSKGNAQRASGTPHTWVDTHNAWDGGRMNQWPRYKNAASMGYFQEAELPFQYALANAFTVCDDYHCAMHTGTHANRSFHWTGTNGPTGANVAYVNNVNAWSSTGPSTAGYEWKTYAERLQDAKVSWMVYQNIPNNYGCNPLMGFKTFRKANELSAKPVNTALPQGASPAYAPGDDAGNPLYKGIANTLPVADQAAFDAGAIFDAFRADVKAGRLPQVSWIIPTDVNSEHPGPSSPVQGAWYVQQVLDALTAVPEVWSKTVFIVNFDENDGYFDHVPSPSAPSPLAPLPNADKQFAGKTTLSDADMSFEYFTHPVPPGMPVAQPAPDGNVYGPGQRVPMYVISPWSRGGWVNSQVFDHTSVLRFIEARFGVAELNISPFRRAVCGDLTSAFNFATPNAQDLPTLSGRKSKAEADKLRADQQALPQIVPPASAQLPRQATGTRPSRALPYELHASAKTDAVNGRVQLVFANTGAQAAVFHVYDRLNLDRLPRRYMVEAGKTLDDSWNATTDNAGLYDLWVLGPNGFHRHFKGDLNTLRVADAANPEVRVCYDIANGNVYLRMTNAGKKSANFTVRAKAYRNDGPWTAPVAGGATVEQHWELADSGQWYDFAVTCDADPVYYRRFAGRVETGQHSVSDPAMGLGDL